MSNTSFLSSLSFFNGEYRGVNISEPESTEESGLRTSSSKILRKPFNHNAPRTRLSSWTNDDDGESRFRNIPAVWDLTKIAESLLPHSPTAYQTPTVPLLPPKKTHRFVRKRQLLTLLLEGSARFFITVGLTAGLLLTLFYYAKMPVLRESQKKMFNTLVTSLSMSLGIAIASSFKEVAINIRWWVLSRKKRPLSEVSTPVLNKLMWKLTNYRLTQSWSAEVSQVSWPLLRSRPAIES
jgi:hypothetical protein